MKNLSFLCVLIIISTSCLGQKKNHTYYDIAFHHIEFTEITLIIDKKQKDTLKMEGVLKGKTIIDDIPCHGKITFTKGWKLRKFTLAGDHVFGKNTFPKGTFISLNIDVQKDIKSMSDYHAVRNARNRTVNSCKFTSNQLINGLSCNGSEGVYFRTDWNLLVCILAEDDTVAGNVLPKNTLVRFNNDGTIYCYCLNDPQIQGYTCSGTDYKGFWMGGGGVELYPSGRLKYFQPVDDTEIQGVVCKRSEVRGGILLYEDGTLKSCTSAIDQTIDSMFCKKNSTLKFDENGKITYAAKEKIFD